jgi:hypothetical protein
VHRADWPRASELRIEASESARLFVDARELTAAIRHHRSTAGLGFNTRVRIEGLTLSSSAWERHWPSVSADLLEGNNVEDVDVTFAQAGTLEMKLVPLSREPGRSEPHA